MKFQYNRNRYYDQYTGRWLTHDPLGITPNPQRPNRFEITAQYSDGSNLYGYGGSNPLSRIDPFGNEISLSTCKKGILKSGLDPSVRKLYDRAKTKGDIFGLCLRNIKCICCCKDPMKLGHYNPFKRSITLCAKAILNWIDLQMTIKHELIHAVSMCGWPKLSCKACMKEEIRAYYWSGGCYDPISCAKAAWNPAS
ncbi:MAG: hypothetical protein KAY65_02670 [Planctomycetes bacterium]|nr:hypothetical protein [Planctomycetota bacterium]